MENASNALIIAGSVLIAVAIISITMYFYNSFVDYNIASSSEKTASDNEAFNRYFLYAANSSGKVTGFEAYNIINKAFDMNEVLDTDDLIHVYLNGSEITSLNASYSTNNSWLEAYHKYDYKWGTTGKVNEVRID